MEMKPANYIEGIQCKVNNCAYNKQSACTAKSIQVGPQYAASTQDTNCATFKAQ